MMKVDKSVWTVKKAHGTKEMIHWVKVLEPRQTHLSLIPITHILEGQNRLLQVVL